MEDKCNLDQFGFNVFGHVIQMHSLAVVGLLRSELFQDVPHASGFDLHLGVRVMHAYATVLELAWF